MNGTVVLTATDTSAEFEELLDNWICHVARVGISPLVWALDAATHSKLRGRPGVTSIYSPELQLPDRARPGAYKKPSSDEYTLAVALKPLVMLRVLKLGFDALFLDVDIALLGDPRPWLRRAPDDALQLSLNYDDRPAQQRVTGSPDLNTGVVYARRRPGMIELFEQWASRTATRQDCPKRPPLWACGDQEQLTRLLRQCGWRPLTFDAAAKLEAHNNAQDVRCGGGIGALRIEVLPPYRFATGQTSALWRMRRGESSRRFGGGAHFVPSGVFTFHPNFGGFAGGAKKAMLKRLRYDSGLGSIATGWCRDRVDGRRLAAIDGRVGTGDSGGGGGGEVAGCAEAWLSKAEDGYCDTTDEGESDCVGGDKGSWPLSPADASSWRHAAAACTAKCASCSRCRHVSVSPQWKDCSWFYEQRCEPQHSVQGFKTAPACAHLDDPTFAPVVAAWYSEISEERRSHHRPRARLGGGDGGGDRGLPSARVAAAA